MSLEAEIQDAINRCNRESESDTPDFLLARFLVRCLAAFEAATQARDEWFGSGIGAHDA